jgi:hypothetical protein
MKRCGIVGGLGCKTISLIDNQIMVHVFDDLSFNGDTTLQIGESFESLTAKHEIATCFDGVMSILQKLKIHFMVSFVLGTWLRKKLLNRLGAGVAVWEIVRDITETECEGEN